MKSVTKSNVDKKIFNFYTFFTIISLSFMIPLELNSFNTGNSALFNFIEKLSFWIFDEICNYSKYYPSFFMIILPLGFLYILGEKIKTSKFAFLCCLILSTSLGYVFFSKINPEQSIAVSLALGSIYSYFFTFFSKDENKKYLLIVSLILMILSGLINFEYVFVIFFIMLVSSAVFKNFKNIIISLALISVFVLFFAFKAHSNITISFTIMPVIVLLSGAFPWIISLLLHPKRFSKLNTENNFDKFLLFNIISVSIIILFSILINVSVAMAYPFISSLIACIWYDYIFKNEENKIKKSILFLIIAFILSVVSGLIFPIIQNTHYFELIKNILRL